MILLNFRMHRTDKNRLAGRGRHPGWILFQRHSAFRAIARPIGLDPGTHRTKILCGRRWFGRVADVVVLGMAVRFFVPTATIAGHGRGFSLAAATGTFGVIRRVSPGQKLFPARLAAKIKRLSVTFRAEHRRFVHRHSANGVNGHINSVSFGWFMQ
jgi:hypothetical protein